MPGLLVFMLVFWFKRNFLKICLVFIVGFLAWENYTPGTWLSGWDTLHPEFDLSIYLSRVFFGVWQEHQGLGAVASQAHAAELPRLVFYYLTSLFGRPDLVRYLYFGLSWMIGSLGMYAFLEKIFKNQWLSFLGVLFYVFSLATLQQFYFPFEIAATSFAALPWLFLFASNFVDFSRKKDLVWFCIAAVFSSSMAHTPTLWYVYFLALSTFVLILGLSRRRGVRRGLVVIASMVVLNSFWLLPNVYFVVNHGWEVVASKISSNFSETNFLTARKFGTVRDTILMKNLFFDWGEYDVDKRMFVDALDEWKGHLDQKIVKIIGYSLFLLVIGGVVASLLDFKKRFYGVAVFPIWALAFLAIANDNSLGRWVYSFVGDYLPVFKEALRFPFNKFAFLLLLGNVVYFAVALDLVCRLIRNKLLLLALFSMATVGILYPMLPAFQGNFVSKSMRVKIPSSYFEMFEWFKNRGDGRIAIFPVNSFWGWVYHDWGYQGAGFIWFGLKQPTLNREFDRWGGFNENYYWEVSRAVYAKDLELFESVVEKYQVRWLVVDESVISPSSAKAVYTIELEEMLERSRKIWLKRAFGKIKVYEVGLETPVENFVWAGRGLPTVGPKYKWSDYDVAFLRLGHYVVSDRPGVYYPFRSLFTGRRQEDREFRVEDLPPLVAEVDVRIGKKDDAAFWWPELEHKNGYLVEIESKNIKGRRLLAWWENLNSRRADWEVYLPDGKSYWVQPPMEEDGIGYALHIENQAIGREEAVNELGRIRVYKLPYKYLTELVRVREFGGKGKLEKVIEVKHPNPAWYEVKLAGNEEILVLSQAYNPGWMAFGGGRILERIMVDNWANGWKLAGEKEIIIVFWPQVLEFAGLGLAVGWFGILWMGRKA